MLLFFRKSNFRPDTLFGHGALPVLRQNSMRATNGAIPCRDGWPVQVIPSPSSAKNLSRRNAHAVYLIYKRWRNADVFATLGWFGLGSPIIPVVQPSQSHTRKDLT
jgi:hypothetical protein